MEARLRTNYNIRRCSYPGGMTETAIRELLDRQEIHDLLHAYCRLVDGNEPERVAELFVHDCVADYGPGLGGPVRGREALGKLLASGLGHFEATHHQVSNIEIDLTSESHATGV